MTWTIKNHYNPCFWIALWNAEYYAAMEAGKPRPGSCRNQRVWVLNVKKNCIYQEKVNNVHFDKNVGEAEISREAAEEFCLRHHPDKYDNFCRQNKNAEYPLFLNLEQLISAIEQLPDYQILPSIAISQRITNPFEKGFLAGFVFLQRLRSHAIMNASIEFWKDLGIPKFEYFVMLSWMLSDFDYLSQGINPLSLSHWKFYKAPEDTFPLGDSAVMTNRSSIIVALSPRLLLEIDPSKHATQEEWQVPVEPISEALLAEYRIRTIGNSFRAIIFSSRKLLERWKDTEEFQNRVKVVHEMKGYNAIVGIDNDGEIWKFNAYAGK